MKTSEKLLSFLDEIGESLKSTGHARALLGLGSVGCDMQRIDQFSDIDFFVIAESGFKQRYIGELDWLTRLCPIAYSFQNTLDGHKVLFENGIFAEFAVFEMHELKGIPYSPGRIIWKKDHADEKISVPTAIPHNTNNRSTDWLVGEALTNLYVGLGRWHRGEKLSGCRFIEQYALDRIIELSDRIEIEQSGHRDIFSPERRFELRFPGIASHLPGFIRGYDCCPQSAESMLTFLEQHCTVNRAMAEAIRSLIQIGDK